jgi:hypothetical protein
VPEIPVRARNCRVNVRRDNATAVAHSSSVTG